jgi:hypothetical protein
MYNAHRGMGPPGPVPGTRLAELLEQVRAEFETQAGRSNQHEHERKYTIGPYWCGWLVEWRGAKARVRSRCNLGLRALSSLMLYRPTANDP